MRELPPLRCAEDSGQSAASATARKASLFLAMFAAGAAGQISAQDESKPPLLDAKTVSSHLGKLGDKIWKTRDGAYRALRDSSVDGDGIRLIAEKLKENSPVPNNPDKTADLEIQTRASKIYQHHIDAHIGAIIAKYSNVRPRNSATGDVWLWTGSLAEAGFSAPDYFDKIRSMDYTGITNLYLQLAFRRISHAQMNNTADFPAYSEATRIFVTDWVQAAVRHHFGKPNFDALMQKEVSTIQQYLENMVLGDERWRKNMNRPSNLIPLDNEHLKQVPIVNRPVK